MSGPMSSRQPRRCPSCGLSREDVDRTDGDNRTIGARLAAAEIMLADTRRALAEELKKNRPIPPGQHPDDEDRRFKLLDIE